MNNKHLNIYNNLVKLTRNKKIFENLLKEETFSDRLVLLMFHFAFFLREYKNSTNRYELQKIHDFFFKQLDLSIREIGYGDTSINKRMKEYINLFFLIIDKIDKWNSLTEKQKSIFLSKMLNIGENSSFYIAYFEKYVNYLQNNTFNYFTKDVIRHNF